MCNNNKLCFLGFNQTGDSVNSRPDHQLALCWNIVLSFAALLCTCTQAGFLLLFGLRSVLVHQAEQV